MQNVISLLIPIFILVIFVIAIKERQDVLKLFTDGVNEGLKVIIKIFPHILAITIAISLMRDTGLLTFAIKPIAPILEKIRNTRKCYPTSCI